MKKIILGVAFLGFFGFLCGGEAGAASFGANAFDLNQAAATLELGQNRPQYLAQVDTELRGDATDFTFFLQKIIKILVTFAGAVAVILLIINGLILVTAAGEEDRINTAKKGLTWAGAGLVLITFAYLIAKTAIWVTFIAEIGEEKICKDPVPYPCYGDDNNRSFFCPKAINNPWGINPSPATCNAATGNDECTTRSLQQALWEDGMYHKNAGADYTQSQAVDGKYGRKSQKALFELKKSLNCKDSICDEEIPKSCFEENGELTAESAADCFIKHDDWSEYLKLSSVGLNQSLCEKLEIGEDEEDIDGTNYYYNCTFSQFLKKYENQKDKFKITPWADGKIPDEILDSVFWRWTWSGDREPADSLKKTLTKLNEQLIYSIDSCKKASQQNRQYDYCTEFALKNWQNLQCNGEFDPHPICEMEIIKQCGKKGDSGCKSFYTESSEYTRTVAKLKNFPEVKRVPDEWIAQGKEKIPAELCLMVNKSVGCTIREIQEGLDFEPDYIDGIYGDVTYRRLIAEQKKFCEFVDISYDPYLCAIEIKQGCEKEGAPGCTSFYKVETERIPDEWLLEASDGSFKQNIPKRVCFLAGAKVGCTIRDVQQALGLSVDGIYGRITFNNLDNKNKKRKKEECENDQ